MNTEYISEVDDVLKTATMKIIGEIGSEVYGKDFVDQLHQLEASGITNINIRINSGGGSVIDGYQIFSAILKSKSNITTYNDGIAASSAGWIFLAGKNAIMSDYALFMMHNPSSTDTSAIGKKRVEMMRKSITMILAKRTGTSVADTEKMMNAETWLSADDAVAKGYASSIVETGLLVPMNPMKQSVNEMFAIVNSVLNKNKNDMAENLENEIVEETVNEVVEETTNEVVEETSEDQVEETVIEDEEPVNEVEETTNEETVEVIDVDNKVDVINTYVNRIAELQKEIDELKEVEAKRVEDEKVKAGTELVSNAINIGKIKPEAKEEWIELAKNNYTLTKSALDAILMNAKAPDIMNAVKANDKPAMTLREMEKAEPNKVVDIYNNNRPLYNQMYFEQYGTMPG
jgi:ATP-dependent protease ClpP protease subunit